MQSKWYINKLYISNFKPFPYCVPLKEISFCDEKFHSIIQYTMLSGPNGYGKTTIFQAIEFVLTGKIEIFEFKDRNKVYSEHICINEIGKESIVVAEFWDSAKKTYISIVRYNPNVQSCTEVECKDEFKNFDLYILDEKFKYESFIKGLENKEISPSSSDEVKKKFDEFDMNEWINSNYIKQEQSSNLLFKNNSGRVDFINGFIEKSQEEYFTQLNQKLSGVSNAIESLSADIAGMSKANLDKELASIGEKQEEQVVFEEDANILWDKKEYEEGENFEQYLLLTNELNDFLTNYEDYKSYHIISRLKHYNDSKDLLYLTVLKCLFYDKKTDYLKRYSAYKYLKQVKEVGLLKAQLDKSILDEKFIENITRIKDEKTVIDSLSTEEEKIYAHIRELRQQIMIDEKMTNKIFDSTCPLCGNKFENSKLLDNVKAYEKEFTKLGSMLNTNINIMNKRLEEQLLLLNETLEQYINNQSIESNIVEKFNEVDKQGKEILLAQNELESLANIHIKSFQAETEFSDISILETVKKIASELERVISNLQDNLKTKGFNEIFNQDLYLGNHKYLKYCTKDNIGKIKDNLKSKILNLKWYKRKQDYDRAVNNKKVLFNMSAELKAMMIYKKKLEKIIKCIKDAKSQYLEEIIRYIEIPLYIYSGNGIVKVSQSGSLRYRLSIYLWKPSRSLM